VLPPPGGGAMESAGASWLPRLADLSPAHCGQVIGSTSKDRISALPCRWSAANWRHRRRRRRRGRYGNRLLWRRRLRRGASRDQRRRNHDGEQRGSAQPTEASLLFGNVVHPFPPELRESSTLQRAESDRQRLTSKGALRFPPRWQKHRPWRSPRGRTMKPLLLQPLEASSSRATLSVRRCCSQFAAI
jgi:hypothetical protein